MIGNRLIPEYFAGQPIKYRFPYTMPGELVVPANASGVQFPANAFLHNVDKPFEIWRMLVHITAFDSQSPSQMMEVQPQTLRDRIRLSIQDLSKNQAITKNPQLVSDLLKENEKTWEWEVPYTIVRQEGMLIAVDSQDLPSVCASDPDDACVPLSTQVGSVRIEIAFQGFLLYLTDAANR
jgi:hypothetical protein